MGLLEFWEGNRPRSYETSWHHKWVCRVLERAYSERLNAVIECPPRGAKSELANVYGPCWWLGQSYDECFGLVCNSDALAKKFSVAARGLVGQPLEVDRDNQWKIRGVESLNYSYMATSIRGQMTGHGFDVVMFDDLLKSGMEAKSDQVRESVWDNVVSAAINRLSPRGIVVALQARLHEADPIGKLLSLEHLKFLRLHIPATNDSGQEAFFEDGYTGDRTVFPAYDSYWPSRWPRKKLDEIRATVTPYYWNAQYQAAPSMGDLGYFDVAAMQSYDSPQAERVWLAVDAANTATSGGSWTAFVCLGLWGGQLKVLGVQRGRWRQDQMRVQLVSFYESMGRLTGIFPEAVIVERAAAGYGIIDTMSSVLPIVPVMPKGSKEDRAASVCFLVNRGQVALPRQAPWLQTFKDELAGFPLCADKDQVDSFVHALSYASRPSEFAPVKLDQVVEYDALEEHGGSLDFERDQRLLQEPLSPATQRALERLGWDKEGF